MADKAPVETKVLDGILESSNSAVVSTTEKVKTDLEKANEDKIKDAEKIETEKKLADEEKNKGTNKNEPGGDKDEIDEAKVLAFLQNKKGFKGKSIDELTSPPPAKAELTEKEKLEAAENKKKEILVFGLQTGKIKTEGEYRNYIKDINTPARDLAYNIYKADRLEDEPELTEEEIADDFKSSIFEDLEETDKRRISAGKKLEATKANYIKSKYNEIEGIENDYDQHIKEGQEFSQYGEKIETLFNEVPDEYTFEIKDPADDKKKYSYNFKISPETKEAFKDVYKGDDYFNLFSKTEMKDEILKNTIINSLKQKDFDKIITEISHAHASAMLENEKKGRRGAAPQREDGSEGSMVVSSGISDQLISQNKN